MADEKTPEELQATIEELESKVTNLESDIGEKDSSIEDLKEKGDLTQSEKDELQAYRDQGMTPEEIAGEEITKTQTENQELKTDLRETKKELVRIKILKDFPDVPEDLIKGESEEDMRSSATKVKETLDERYNKGRQETEDKLKQGLMPIIPGAGGGSGASEKIISQTRKELLTEKEEAMKKGNVSRVTDITFQLRALEEQEKKAKAKG